MPHHFSPPKISECLQTWLHRSPVSAEERELWAPRAGPREPIAAAVLVPIIQRESELTVLFTQRTTHLTDHAGQISFPGGRMEPEDHSMEETALRETEEEIGLARRYVALLGRLPEYVTGTGFRVTPVVGWIEPSFSLVLDPFEVAEVFEVPIAFLLDPANHQRKSAIWEGREHRYYAITYQERNIWGATAGMLRSLYMALSEPDRVLCSDSTVVQKDVEATDL